MKLSRMRRDSKERAIENATDQALLRLDAFLSQRIGDLRALLASSEYEHELVTKQIAHRKGKGTWRLNGHRDEP